MAGNIIAVVQARMGSTRFPGKVLKEIMGKSLLQILIERLCQAKRLSQIVVATSDKERDEPIVTLAQELGIDVVRGGESDVLGRYQLANEIYDPDAIVRITGDCPLIDPEIVDRVVAVYEKNLVDYVSNVSPPTWPDGLDVEVIKARALSRASAEATCDYDREHLTNYIQMDNSFSKMNVTNKQDLSGERWTVDYPADFEKVKEVIEYFSPSLAFGWSDVLRLQEKVRPILQDSEIERD